MSFSGLKLYFISFALLSQAFAYKMSENDPKDYDFDFLSFNNKEEQWRRVAKHMLLLVDTNGSETELLEMLTTLKLEQKPDAATPTFFAEASGECTWLINLNDVFGGTTSRKRTLRVSFNSREFSVELDEKRISLKTAGLLKDFGPLFVEKYYFKATFPDKISFYESFLFAWLMESLNFGSRNHGLRSEKYFGRFEFPSSPLPNERFYKDQLTYSPQGTQEGVLYCSVKKFAGDQQEVHFFLLSADEEQIVGPLAKEIEDEGSEYEWRIVI